MTCYLLQTLHTVQKVKKKNMLPKYVGSFTADVRTVYFSHGFENSSPFRGILRRNSEAIITHMITCGGPKYANIFQIRSGVALHHKHLPRDIFQSFERVFIRLLMSEVSNDSKVKHMHEQTFCKRYFFDEKYSPKEKNCLERKQIKIINYPYQTDTNNKGKVIQTIVCVFRAIECMVCR